MSAVSYRLSAIGCQLSAVSYRLSAIGSLILVETQHAVSLHFLVQLGKKNFFPLDKKNKLIRLNEN